MAHANTLFRRFCAFCFQLALLLLSGGVVWAQQTDRLATSAQTEAAAASVRELQEQVRELREAVGELREEAARFRAQTQELRATIAELAAASRSGQATQTGQSATSFAVPQESTGVTKQQTVPPSLEDRMARLEEESQLEGNKIDEQYQTKVESASKYRVRLSGIVLLNLFRNSGAVDNQDIPNIAVGPSGIEAEGRSFGGTLRQSEIGLEVFGPRLAGARTSGDIQFDFGGGFPETPNGITSGLMRLRTGTMRLEWSNTSIVAGQDNIFFSPLSPTSFASLIVPAFGYSGNLWAWVPQVRVEQRFDVSSKSSFTLQGGILDNLTGEPPGLPYQQIQQAGQRSGQPAYGVRMAWTGSAFGKPITIGTGGYYSRQAWGFDRYVDGWAGTADWDIPLGGWFSLSGEFYRGRAVGGLGGGLGYSVVYSGLAADPATQLRSVDSVGGWSQLKFRPTSRLEFNGALGLDNAMGEDLRAFSSSQSDSDMRPARNRTSFVNFIYRPYSNLLFSMEYRRLRTFQVNGESHTADQVNLMMGVLF